VRRTTPPTSAAIQIYKFGPFAVIGISGRLTASGITVAGVGEKVAVVGEASANGVVVKARAVAVNSKALGVKVKVAVGAPKFVGVEEKVRARDVEVRKEAPAVFVCCATIVFIPCGVGVGE